MVVGGTMNHFALVIILGIFVFVYGWWEASDPAFSYSLQHAKQISLDPALPQANLRQSSCHHFSCFDIYKCGSQHSHLSVYIYPLDQFITKDGSQVAPLSKEFIQLLDTIKASKFYSPEPSEAGLFVPTIDLLNLGRVNTAAVAQSLARAELWDQGSNHIIFNMFPGSLEDLRTDRAIIASAGLTRETYRPGLDISLPAYNPLFNHNVTMGGARRWFLLSSQVNLKLDIGEMGEGSRSLVVLEQCNAGDRSRYRCLGNRKLMYPEVLSNATFCLVTSSGQPDLAYTLFNSLGCGCIPVIISDTCVLPFSEVLDWNKFSYKFYEHDLAQVMDFLSSVSETKIREMQVQLEFVFQKYFSSIRAITLTTLNILNTRIYPQNIITFEDWNIPPQSFVPQNPLFLPVIPPPTDGFTAVILTYDRLESLFSVITRVSAVPSLSRIIVVWNHQTKPPPPVDQWPRVNKPLKIIQSSANVLSSRFYPYDEIETEAVLSLDDDINMLTSDEMEFAYHVWREFPDRLVGFPSRSHVWDNSTSRWKYESEWTNDISMVLTGAAFYHKLWHYKYTAAVDTVNKDIKAWVDQHMNCEDIAFNFMVANATGKAPIKVAPRKKFKCSTPSCDNVQMLSSDQGHLIERSECVNMLVGWYGGMPLRSVEFRADPVLYKDSFPEMLKMFNDIGSL